MAYRSNGHKKYDRSLFNFTACRALNVSVRNIEFLLLFWNFIEVDPPSFVRIADVGTNGGAAIDDSLVGEGIEDWEIQRHSCLDIFQNRRPASQKTPRQEKVSSCLAVP